MKKERRKVEEEEANKKKEEKIEIEREIYNMGLVGLASERKYFGYSSNHFV